MEVSLVLLSTPKKKCTEALTLGLTAILFVGTTVGCGNSQPGSADAKKEEDDSFAVEVEPLSDAGLEQQSSFDDRAGLPGPETSDSLGGSPPQRTGPPATDRAPGTLAPQAFPPVPSSPEFAGNIESALQLPSVNDFATLAQFLSEADREIERLGQLGMSLDNRDQLIADLKRVGKLKQEAAERLLVADGLTSDQRSLAIRARLQALSHQFALEDLQAGITLEEYARELLDYPSPEVVRDCRTVLVAVELDRLQTGGTSEPSQVVKQAELLASDPQLLDVSSVIVLQRSMMILGQYGYAEAARTVAALVKQVVQESSDPQVTEVGQQVLATARFAALESMRAEIQAARVRSAEEWFAEASAVASEAQDLVSAEYLASLALQLEAFGQPENAKAIYAAMTDSLAVSNDQQVADAALTAIRAYEVRVGISGTPLNLDIRETITGSPFDLQSYRGQVVVMPYWSIEQSDSLMTAANVEDYLSQFGNQVRILGVNMDVSPAGFEQAQRLARDKMPWPSLAGFNLQNPEQSSPLVDALGVVSVPTVVVLDKDLRVFGVFLSQESLEQAIARLLPGMSPSP